MESTSKLVALRNEMKEHGLDILIINHQDSHGSEYLAPTDERIAYISHFQGSNGLCLVSQQEAFLWTDSRYYLAAEKQLDQGWTMCKMEQGQQTWQEWLTQNAINKTVGYDSRLMSIASLEGLQKSLKQVTLTDTPSNLVDMLWQKDQHFPQPTMPSNKVVPLKDEYTGETVHQKILRLREKMNKQNVNSYVVTKLDDICWALNLRGTDIQFNPVFFSFLLVTSQDVILFSTQNDEHDLQQYCQQQNILLLPYSSFYHELQSLSSPQNVLVSKSQCNAKVHHILSAQEGITLTLDVSPLECMKALKNETELQGMVQCHKWDGAALAMGFSFIEQAVLQGKSITEYEFAEYLDSLRCKQPLSQGISFETISASGANAAIVHYKPTPQECAPILRDNIFLCDSGGQYLNGTTDVTRTFHWAEQPSQVIKDRYTRVLLGNLDLERLIWPKNKGITGGHMDVLARRHLWAEGLDYGHGTGHGVGHYLNVHEGPQGISLRSQVPLEKGMVVTDEPGYYQSGEFGIRIENELVVVSTKDTGTLYFIKQKIYSSLTLPYAPMTGTYQT